MAFLGDIKIFAGNFAPRGWEFCNGQPLPVSQYAALYSLLGTTYGGDGIREFKLPDLRNRTVIGQGRSIDGNFTPIAGVRGANIATINIREQNIPSMLVDVSIPSKVAVVKAQTISTKNSTGIEFDVPTEYGTTSEKQTISIEGDGQPITIDNYQPSIGLSYIICVEDGEYPPRS